MAELKTALLDQNALPCTLTILTADKQRELPLHGRQLFGRSSTGNEPDISTSSRSVSRRHGCFMQMEDGLHYEDLGSTNGTTRNGTRLAAHQSYTLQAGDVLRVHGSKDAGHVMDVLLVVSGADGGGRLWRSLELREDIAEIAVGREQALHLSSPAVSRRHASFFHASGGWAVIDHGSTNGVLVNGRRIGYPVYLEPMDVISISGYLFLFTGARFLYQYDAAMPKTAVKSAACASKAFAAPAWSPAPVPQKSAEVAHTADPKGLTVWIEERNVWHRAKKKTLLRDIDLEIPNGSMVLVLGGSGAGKTTFMNAVMGYERASGEILYNGIDIYEEYSRMKYEIGYVPQQDLLRMNDTVSSTLLNAAYMRLPKGLTDYQQRVEQTAELLGLTREMNSLVGKLSGGQRKRLSIAVEYIGNPALFFLDEPDSGLDGVMARALLENLRAIADQGKIVIVISHAPDRAYELFDQVLVLAKDSREDCGRMAFFGTPDDACRFFETDSLEHIVKRINRPDEGGDGMADHFIDRFARWGSANG